MKSIVVNFSLSQLLGAGVHLGHLKSSWNLQSSVYILGLRNFLCIFDLEQAVLLLRQALKFVIYLVSKREQLVVISRLNYFIKLNRRVGQSFITVKPIGGVLTNLKEFKRCLRYLNTKEKQPFFFSKFFNYIILVMKLFNFFRLNKRLYFSDKRKFLKQAKVFMFILLRYYKMGFRSSKYLLSIYKQAKFYYIELRKFLLYKQRKLNFFKFLNSLSKVRCLGGVFILDLITDFYVYKDALRLQVPLVGVVDSDCNLAGVTYPIIGNNDSPKVVELYLNLFSKAINKGLNLEKLTFKNFRLTKSRIRLIKRSVRYKHKMNPIKFLKFKSVNKLRVYSKRKFKARNKKNLYSLLKNKK